MSSEGEIVAVTGNANRMDAFEDEMFDLVLSNATLEHDKHFWLSVAEMHRVLRPGGLLVIGVPGFIKDPDRDQGRSTLTYRVHYRFDSTVSASRRFARCSLPTSSASTPSRS